MRRAAALVMVTLGAATGGGCGGGSASSPAAVAQAELQEWRKLGALERSGVIHGPIRDVAVDTRGNVWFAASYGAVNRLTRSGGEEAPWRFYEVRPSRDGSWQGDVQIEADSAGGVWLLVAGELFRYDPSAGDRWVAFTNASLGRERFSRLAVSGDAVWLWAGSRAIRYHVGKNTVDTFAAGFKDAGQPDLVLAADGSPRLVGTQAICELDPIRVGEFRCRRVRGIDDGGIFELVGDRHVAADGAGNVWLHYGGTLFRLYQGDSTWTRMLPPAEGEVVTALSLGAGGALRCGTRSGGVYELDGSGWRGDPAARTHLATPVVAIVDDKDGGTWAAAAIGTTHRDKPGGTWTAFSNPIISPFRGTRLNEVRADAKGLWFATDSGLYRISPAGEWSHLGQPLLPDDDVTLHTVDATDNLWVLTRRGGFGRVAPSGTLFDARPEELRRVLGTEPVSQFLADDNGTMWFAAGRRVIRLSPREGVAVEAGRFSGAVRDFAVDGRGDLCVLAGLGQSLECVNAGARPDAIVRPPLGNILEGPVSDGADGFWVSVGEGLVRVRPRAGGVNEPMLSRKLWDLRDVVRLAVDPSGPQRAVWAFTQTEAARYDAVRDELRRFPLPIRGRVVAATVDVEGAAWVGDATHLARIGVNAPGHVTSDVGTQIVIGDRFAPTLVAMERLDGGVERMVTNTPSGMAFRSVTAKEATATLTSEAPNGAETTALAPGPRTYTWVGTRLSGLLLRDPAWESSHPTPALQKPAIPSNTIVDLSPVPGTGFSKVWAASGGGAFRASVDPQDPSSLRVDYAPANAGSVASGPADAVVALADGGAIVAYSPLSGDYFGAGAGKQTEQRASATLWQVSFSPDGKSAKEVTFAPDPSASDRFGAARIRDLAVDETREVLWIATSAGLFRATGWKSGARVISAETANNTLPAQPIRRVAVAPDGRGTVWMAMEGGENNPDSLVGLVPGDSSLSTVRLPTGADWSGVIEGMAFSPDGDVVISSGARYFRGRLFVPERGAAPAWHVLLPVGLAVAGSLAIIIGVVLFQPRVVGRAIAQPGSLAAMTLPQMAQILGGIEFLERFLPRRRLLAGSALETRDRRRLAVDLADAKAEAGEQLSSLATLLGAKPAGAPRKIAPGIHLLAATFAAPDPLKERTLALLLVQTSSDGLAVDAGRAAIERALDEAKHPVEYPLLLVCRDGELPDDLLPPAYSTLRLSDPEIKQLVLATMPPRALAGLLFTNGLLTTALSPYSVSGEVKKSMFFGRADLLKRMVESPEKRFIVVGPRRVGKTSLLRRLEDALRDRNPDSKALFVSFWNQQSADWLVQAAATALQIPADASLPTDEQLAQVLREHARRGGAPPVLLIDEADRFVRADAAAGFRSLAAMRRLQDERACSFVLAGFQWLLRETRDQRSPLFNFANVITLGALDPEAARRLAEQPLAERLGVRYADDRLPVLVATRTGGYPSFVQLLCDQILRQLTGGELVITEEHIRAAEETEEVRGALRDVFRQNVPPVGRVVAFKLLDVDEFGLQDIDRVLAEVTGRRIRLQVIEEIAAQLRLFGFVEETRDGRFRWALPMLRESLRNEGYAADRLAEELPEDESRWLELSESK